MAKAMGGPLTDHGHVSGQSDGRESRATKQSVFKLSPRCYRTRLSSPREWFMRYLQ